MNMDKQLGSLLLDGHENQQQNKYKQTPKELQNANPMLHLN